MEDWESDIGIEWHQGVIRMDHGDDTLPKARDFVSIVAAASGTLCRALYRLYDRGGDESKIFPAR